MSAEFTTLAAAAAVDTDAAVARWARKAYPRRLISLGMAGSAQPGDYELAVVVDGIELGRYRNSRGGANTSPNNDDQQGVGVPIPANYLLQLLCKVAPTTNAGTIRLFLVP